MLPAARWQYNDVSFSIQICSPVFSLFLSTWYLCSPTAISFSCTVMDATTLAVRNTLLPDLQTLASSSSTRFGARRVDEEDARVRRSGTRGQAEGLEVRAPIRLAVLAGSFVACHVAISRLTGCLCQLLLSCFIVMCPSYYPCGYKNYPCGYKNYPIRAGRKSVQRTKINLHH